VAVERRRPGKRPLRRRVGTRRPRKTFLVFCEGARTEPEYLNALKLLPAVRDVAAVDLQVGPGHGVPKTLVTRAIEARSRAIEEDAEIDEFWCVFDVEWPKNHPRLQEAIEEAALSDVHVAVSNPCFELWLILHFRDQAEWLNNAGARRLRSDLDGSSNKGLDPVRYMPLVGEAARRAAELDEQHRRSGTRFPRTNPSSGMHRLLAAIEPGGL
jgi:hypothetical protein